MVIAKKLKLYLEPETALLFENLAEKQTSCTNWWIDKIREIGSVKLAKLQESYYKAREGFGLGAAMTQLAMFRAIRLKRKEKKEISHTLNRLLSFKDITLTNEINFRTGTHKRIKVKFKSEILPKGKIKESIVKKINGEWYCFLNIDIEEPRIKVYKRCMGVDLGVAKIAVVADWNGYNTRFFKGEPLRFVKNHYRKLRTNLLKNIKKGNSYKTLKKIYKKENNWVTNENHRISKEIVEMAIKNKRTIILENLTGITERLKFNRKTNNMLRNWSFRQLADFISYKGKMSGIQVIKVDPRNTSKTCPKCQYCSRKNRQSQERFKCVQCGYESNADRVGAMNIALRGGHVLLSHGLRDTALM